MVALEMDGVEDALCRADAAADALVGVDPACAAAEAAGRLGLHLLGRERFARVAERMRVHGGIDGLGLPRGMVVAVDGEILLIQHDKVAPVAADGETCALVDIAVQRFGGALALFNRVNDEFRAVVHIAADENVLFRCLIGQRIGDGVVAAVEFDLCAGQKPAPFDGLPMANTTCSAGSVIVSASS